MIKLLSLYILLIINLKSFELTPNMYYREWALYMKHNNTYIFIRRFKTEDSCNNHKSIYYENNDNVKCYKIK